MDNFTHIFIEEARELFSKLESTLLELEQYPTNRELVQKVFRVLHTIKGSGSMFGFDELADFAHQVETIFDNVRDGQVPVTTELINLALAARDTMQHMLDAQINGVKPDLTKGRAIVLKLAEFQKSHQAPTLGMKSSTGEQIPEENKPIHWQIAFYPHPDIFRTGLNPALLLDELQQLGPCRIKSQLENVPDLNDLDPETCYMGWAISLTTHKGYQAIRDVFIFVEEESQLDIRSEEKILEAPLSQSQDKDASGLSEPDIIGGIILSTSHQKHHSLTFFQNQQQEMNQDPVEKPVDSSKVKTDVKPAIQPTITTIKVPSDKLDALVDIVGELVTVQARLTRKSTLLQDPELVAIAEEVERLTVGLRENTMNIRMLPIGTLFSRFHRLVRDLSQQLGKTVTLITEGGKTLLDKTILDMLNDPLMHLIRNCMDHGIELPETRRDLGKPDQGTIRLSASQSGAHVVIRISDDGSGLDLDAIREKAIQQGLISSTTTVTDDQLCAIIFTPGFSISDEVTAISGRGVGLDVVRRQIEQMRGTVDVKTKKGKGSEFVLKLPLSLAIIDGLMVKVEDGVFVVPLAMVEECLELSSVELEVAEKQHIIRYRNAIIPYLNLRKVLDLGNSTPHRQQIVIVDMNDSYTGIGVDRVMGQHHTVIKPLGKTSWDIQGISGATILGDGSVALVLDMNQLMEMVPVA